jgi:hypothetical protein
MDKQIIIYLYLLLVIGNYILYKCILNLILSNVKYYSKVSINIT